MKFALILNDDFSMFHFRGALISTLVEHGAEVYVIVPPGQYHEQLKSLGAKVIPIEMKRFVSPLSDFKLMFQLFRVFRSHPFDIVHTMTIKPNTFGVLAAKLAGVKRIVCLVSGSGYMFSESTGFKSRLIKIMMLSLYRFALLFSDRVWFQNQDDLNEFIEKRLLNRDQGVVIRGSGVNLQTFCMANIDKESLRLLRKELDIPPNMKCVVMVAARMIWSKGVKQFIEASHIIRARYPDWVFIMLAPREEDSFESVPHEYINQNKHSNLRVIEEFCDNVQYYTALSDILVLVSYYREGVPRSLLEGLSMEKPIITTDSPGCREVVKNGRNGFLVPARNTKELVDKLDQLMTDDNLRDLFGKYSRHIAEKHFDEDKIARKVMNEIYQIPYNI